MYLLVRIFGVDPGLLHTGFAEIMGDTETGKAVLSDDIFGVLKTMKWADKARKIAFDDRARAEWIGEELMRIIAVNEPTELAIEDFVYMGRRGGAESQMPMLVEHLRMVGKQMGYNVTVYANGTWKTKTLKCRTANKEQVQHYVRRQFPGIDDILGMQPDHVWDAVGIAYCRWREILKGAPEKVQKGPIGKSKIGRRF